nr:Chain C, ILE-ALA-TYR-GLU-ARG-MET-CYS-ASN-ILE [unidentified influenza virus]
IAYERMCNI